MKRDLLDKTALYLYHATHAPLRHSLAIHYETWPCHYMPCYLNITQTLRHSNKLNYTQTLYLITPLLHNLTSQPILTCPHHYFTTTHLIITSINYTWPHLNFVPQYFKVLHFTLTQLSYTWLDYSITIHQLHIPFLDYTVPLLFLVVLCIMQQYTSSP